MSYIKKKELMDIEKLIDTTINFITEILISNQWCKKKTMSAKLMSDITLLIDVLCFTLQKENNEKIKKFSRFIIWI